MSFYKQYPNRKDKRKPHYGTRAVDQSCTSHGDCPWCQNNRKHKQKKRSAKSAEELKILGVSKAKMSCCAGSACVKGYSAALINSTLNATQENAK